MDFIDSALIRLADPASRAAVFDDAALEQMTQAAYDVAALSLSGPHSPIFDKVRLGVSVAPLGVAEGIIRNQNGVPTADVDIQLGGLGPLLPARVDALWYGSIVARAVTADSRIDKVRATFAVEDIDAAIIKDLGALPTDPAALETARRTAVITELKAGMAQPDLLTDEAFDTWLAQMAVASASDLVVNHRGTQGTGILQIGFSAPGAGQQPTPTALPIVAAILIRDAGFSVAQLLMESKLVRDQLVEQGVAVPTVASLPALNPFLVVWVVPLAVFDDVGWPGTGTTAADLRASRRQQASAWLGPEGIAVAGVEVS